MGILIMCQSWILPPKSIFSKYSLYYIAVVLNQGQLWPPGDILSMFGGITTHHNQSDATGLYKVEAWDADKYAKMHRTVS